MVPDDTDRSRRTVLRAAAGAVGASAIAGAAAAEGDDSVGQAGTTTQQEEDGERVGMVTTEGALQLFTAPVLWVPPETTVTWVNRSGGHSTTAYAPANDRPQRIPDEADPWDSGTLTEEGATFESTFAVVGVYDYYCLPHEGLGMVGRLVVGDPDLENQPALAEPQDSLPSPVQEILAGFNTLTESMFGASQ